MLSGMQLCQGKCQGNFLGEGSLACISLVCSHCPGPGVLLEGSRHCLCRHRENWPDSSWMGSRSITRMYTITSFACLVRNHYWGYSKSVSSFSLLSVGKCPSEAIWMLFGEHWIETGKTKCLSGTRLGWSVLAKGTWILEVCWLHMYCLGLLSP